MAFETPAVIMKCIFLLLAVSGVVILWVAIIPDGGETLLVVPNCRCLLREN